MITSPFDDASRKIRAYLPPANRCSARRDDRSCGEITASQAEMSQHPANIGTVSCLYRRTGTVTFNDRVVIVVVTQVQCMAEKMRNDKPWLLSLGSYRIGLLAAGLVSTQTRYRDVTSLPCLSTNAVPAKTVGWIYRNDGRCIATTSDT